MNLFGTKFDNLNALASTATIKHQAYVSELTSIIGCQINEIYDVLNLPLNIPAHYYATLNGAIASKRQVVLVGDVLEFHPGDWKAHFLEGVMKG